MTRICIPGGAVLSTWEAGAVWARIERRVLLCQGLVNAQSPKSGKT